MNRPSSTSYTSSGTHSHERDMYARQPDTSYDARVSNSDQANSASEFISDFDDSLTLAPALSTPSAPFPTASSFSYPPVDVKGMSMPTPHSRPQTTELPSQDDGSIYLHSPYGPFTDNYWNGMQIGRAHV